MRAGLASGQLRQGDDLRAGFPEPPGNAPSEVVSLLPIVDGRCAFFERTGGHACAIHRTLGHDALPLACRQFPRVSVTDPRGVSVTLSHFCPTAAGLLDGNASHVRIDELAPAFPAAGEYVGLDATTSLPPLVRPDMLMDWASWWEWERLAIETIDRERDAPAVALARLALAVEAVRPWRPDEGALRERVRAAFRAAADAEVAPRQMAKDEVRARLKEVIAAMPRELRPTESPTRARPAALRPVETPTRVSHLLAAHAFASWTAHLGRGLRTWLRSVEAPFALVTAGLDVRTTDLWLRHLAEPRELTAAWGWVEKARDVKIRN